MNINSLLFALIVLLFGFFSLLIPAVKLGLIKKLIRNPAFFVGDFILLPIVGFLIIDISLKEFNILILLVSLFVTLYSGIHFKLMKAYWVPHGIFYFTFTYLVLNFLFNEMRNGNYLSASIIVGLVGVHFFLGIKFPKNL